MLKSISNIFIAILLFVPSQVSGSNPLTIERDALGAVYYWIDNNALTLIGLITAICMKHI